VALGKLPVPGDRTNGETVMVSGKVTVAVAGALSESVTVVMTEKLPACVGVPERLPLLLRVIPVGRPVAPNE
jgi:hypothetical protein